MTDYGHDGWGVTPTRERECSLCHHIQTSSEIHSPSFLMDTEGSFTRGEVAKV